MYCRPLVKTFAISDVVYDWARLERPTPTPTDLPTLMVENLSRSRQVITRTLEEELEESESISSSSEFALETEFAMEYENGETENGAGIGMAFRQA